MRKVQKLWGLALCVLVLCLFARPMQAKAGNVTNGTLGDNGGIQWTYDEDTKTLTVTGEDSGLKGVYDSSIWQYISPFATICEDVEVIKVQNCTLTGRVSGLFGNLKSLRSIEFHNFDTSNVMDMSSMFEGCSNLSSLDVSNFDTSNVTSMDNMFSDCSSLSSLDVSNFDTSNVMAMAGMFFNCSGLSSVDVSNFDTSNVEYMLRMFSCCSGLRSVDVSNFDTSNVTNMRDMFRNCTSLTSVDVSNFDTSNAVDMSVIFSGCTSLTSVDVSNFDTSNATNIASMFWGCSSLRSVDVSNFDTTGVEWMAGLFNDCSSLTSLDLSSFDLTNVIHYGDMLAGCNGLEVVYTPAKIPEGVSIELPDTFVDSKDNETTSITAEFCNDTLRKKVEFSDVPQDQWFYPYVKKAYYNGYMSGTGTDSEGRIIFKPLVNIPREQFVTVLYALEGVDPDSIQYSDRFVDVKASDWFAKPVEWAAQNGIVSGTGNGKFGVGQLITREQMALMLYGYARYKGYDITVNTDISSFPDAGEVSDWAKTGMSWAIQNGIMSGQKAGDKIYLKPKDNASRAVCATMIVAFAEKY